MTSQGRRPRSRCARGRRRTVIHMACAAGALMLMIGAAPISAQEVQPRIVVMQVAPQSSTDAGPSDINAILLGDTVRDILLFNLQLLDEYIVFDRNDPPDNNPQQYAAALDAQYLLWGSVTDTDGALEIRVSVYEFDGSSGRVVATHRETAETLFAVFDAADTLAERVLSSFGDTGFGTVRLAVSGAGDYRVYLNDTVAGTGVTTVGPLFAGAYQVRVEQETPEGPRLIRQETVSVPDGGQVTVDVNLLALDDIRSLLVEEAREALQQMLGEEPLPGIASHRFETMLEQYARYGGSDETVAAYRHAANMHAEYRRILSYQYYDDTQSFVDEQVVERLIPATVSWTDLRARNGLPGEQIALVDRLSRRNRRTLTAVLLLAADYVVVRNAIEEQAEIYAILNQLHTDERSGMRAAPYARQQAEAETFAAEYRRAVLRRRPAWHPIAIATGAAGIAASGIIFGAGLPADRLREADETYAAYVSTNDPDEAVQLREQTQSLYDEANTLRMVGGSAGAVGASLVATGIVARIRSLRGPQRRISEYIDRAGERRMSAAISFFEDGDQDRVVFVRDGATLPGEADGSEATVAGSKEAWIVTTAVVGDTVEWTSPTDDSAVIHTVHSGRNVVLLR